MKIKLENFKIFQTNLILISFHRTKSHSTKRRFLLKEQNPISTRMSASFVCGATQSLDVRSWRESYHHHNHWTDNLYYSESFIFYWSNSSYVLFYFILILSFYWSNYVLCFILFYFILSLYWSNYVLRFIWFYIILFYYCTEFHCNSLQVNYLSITQTCTLICCICKALVWRWWLFKTRD